MRHINSESKEIINNIKTIINKLFLYLNIFNWYNLRTKN